MNRALKAHASGQLRRRKRGRQQAYPIEAELELVKRIKALRSQNFGTYPHLTMFLANGLIKGTQRLYSRKKSKK
ncbi:hypothetical protein OAN61_00105 [bacterium]|nr:hypothetical protein [bacterium]